MNGLPDFLKVVRPEDFVAEVKSIDWLNDKVCSVWFEVVEGKFEFEAGQFVNLKFIDPADSETFIQRAYSVASAPAGKSGLRFELCVEIVEGGKAGEYFSNLQDGDECEFKGPFGFCTLPDNVEKAVLVGTGTGIAPIKGILEDIRNKRLEMELNVLFGFRYENDGFYLAELNDLAKKLEAKIWICMSRDKASVEMREEFQNLEFFEGRVTSLLDSESIISADTNLYICGGSAMIKEVREMGLQSGVDKSRIHVEIFD